MRKEKINLMRKGKINRKENIKMRKGKINS